MMTSEVQHNHEEATYITVETVSFYGVKTEPENVTVNSQEAAFSYRNNQVIWFNIVLGSCWLKNSNELYILLAGEFQNVPSRDKKVN